MKTITGSIGSICLGITLLFLSCKKDSLEGNTALIQGKWNWTYTIKQTIDLLDYEIIYDTIHSHDLESIHSLEFLAKGKIKAYKNNSLTCKDRIIFDHFGHPNVLENRDFVFIILLNNRKKRRFKGYIQADTLDTDAAFSSLPYSDSRVRNIQVSYQHFYLRE